MTTFKYNPTTTELRQAYEVAYGEMGVYHLVGALTANVSPEVLERLYNDAIKRVKDEMLETQIVCVYCQKIYAGDTSVCPECNDYDGLIRVEEGDK
jgi:hypothetical protein